MGAGGRAGFDMGRAGVKRRRLTPSERAALLERQGGLCVSWGCEESENLIEEHSTPYTWTGEKPDQLMCKDCHKEKTRRDIKAIAKVKRIQKKERGEERAKRRLPSKPFTAWRGLSGQIRGKTHGK